MNAAGRSFLWATHYCGAQATYPEVVARRAGTHSRRTRRFAGSPSLFGLAPCGVCPARRITASAVRSYRTFSPLPEPVSYTHLDVYKRQEQDQIGREPGLDFRIRLRHVPARCVQPSGRSLEPRSDAWPRGMTCLLYTSRCV